MNNICFNNKILFFYFTSIKSQRIYQNLIKKKKNYTYTGLNRNSIIRSNQ